jgi:hypothetical protein
MKDDESAGEYAHRTAKPQSLKASVSFGTFPFSSPIPDLGFVPPTEHRVHVVADLLWLASALALRP